MRKKNAADNKLLNYIDLAIFDFIIQNEDRYRVAEPLGKLKLEKFIFFDHATR